MSDNEVNAVETSSTPMWYWIVVTIALLWNLMGLAAYFMDVTMTPETLAALPTDQKMLYEARPLWALIAFSLAVVGGTLGCIGLLLRKSWATLLLWISLAGIIVQMIYNVLISGAIDVYGPGGMIMPILVLIVAAALIWLARHAQKLGWIS